MKNNFLKKAAGIIMAGVMTLSITSAMAVNVAAASTDVIKNNASGIPDKNFYNYAVKTFDKNKDNVLTVAEAEQARMINLSGTKLTGLEGIKYFKNTEVLMIDNCGLKSLPTEIGALTKLETLNASQNSLSSLRANLKYCNLKTLDISQNKFNVFSSVIPYLTDLEVLDISSNNIKSVPYTIRNLTDLRIFKASNNKISSLSGYLYKCTKLENLYLDHNELTYISNYFKSLTNLKVLDVSYNEITKIPSSVGYMKNLERLYASNNKIYYTYKEIANLKKIKEIDLSNNELTFLYSGFGKLTSLEKLKLMNNKMTKLPDLTALNNLIITQEDYFPLMVTGNKISQTYLKKYAPATLAQNSTWLKYQTSSKYVPVTAVNPTKTALTLKAGETATLTGSVSPSNATCKTLTYSMGFTNCGAKVTTSGSISSDKPGIAIVNISSRDGSGVSSTITVTFE